MENIKHIIESLLFVAEEPLTVDKIKRITSHADTQEIKATLTALATEYEVRQGGFYLDEVAGGYQIRTRPEYNQWIRKLIRPKPLRLSKAALETLVIIAYKQPIIRSDIEYLRGVDCGGVLRVLLERKLIRVLGRRELAGRPLIYATTKRFLEVFDLKSLKDLPTPKEIEDLGASLSESEEPVDLDSLEETKEVPDIPEASEATMESSEFQKPQVDTAENEKMIEAPSESQPAAKDTPDRNFTAKEAPQASRAAPAPSAESEFAKDSRGSNEADQSLEEPKAKP
jgi:segregation and condensation protein B